MPEHELLALLRSEFDAVRRYLEQSMNFRKKWISVKEAAEYLGLSESQIRNLINKGALPAHRLKGTIRLNIREIDTTLLLGRNTAKRRLSNQEKQKLGGIL